MKVNDLIELLEYNLAQTPVSVAIVGPDGRVVRHDDLRFLTKDGRVYLVTGQSSEPHADSGTVVEDLDLSQFDCPQVFGHHFTLLPKVT